MTVGSGKGGKRREREMGPNGGTTEAKPTELKEEKERMLLCWLVESCQVCVLSVYVNQAKGEEEEGRNEADKTLPP